MPVILKWKIVSYLYIQVQIHFQAGEYYRSIKCEILLKTTCLLSIALPIQCVSLSNNRMMKDCIPYFPITASYDWFIFAKKSSTLGFKGSVIKSYKASDSVSCLVLFGKMRTYMWYVFTPFTVMHNSNSGLWFLFG